MPDGRVTGLGVVSPLSSVTRVFVALCGGHGDCKIKNQSRNEACPVERGPLRPVRLVERNPLLQV